MAKIVSISIPDSATVEEIPVSNSAPNPMPPGEYKDYNLHAPGSLLSGFETPEDSQLDIKQQKFNNLLKFIKEYLNNKYESQ